MTTAPLTERSHCGIHGLSTFSGRCPECDRAAMTAWISARWTYRSATPGSTEAHAAELESARLERIILAAEEHGDHVAAEFVDAMLDVDETIRLRLHKA